MAQAMRSLVRHIRSMAGLPRTRELSDRQLLQRFVAGEESAFAALVQRHGAMVLGVCQRVLQNGHDAEDAFQATFLVLARKAAGVGWHDSIGNWLHGVAYRIAMKARAGEIRRRLREQKAAADHSVEKTTDINWSDLRRVLDEELERLPARYRAPLLLCYLEGKTRDEAAQELGWSPGSVKGRLERGRELLRARLSRRGLALSAVLCASLLPESAASAAIPISLATATVSAGMQFVSGQAAVTVSAQVLSLTQGVLHAMLWTKIKIATVLILTISALGIGGAIGSKQWQSAAAAESGSSQWQSEDNKPWQLPTATAPADFAEADPPLAFQDNKRERGKEERGQEVSQVRGQVREIDTVKGTISLLLAPARGERKQEIKTYSLASKDIKIVPTFGRRAKLADLKQGMWVTAGLSEEMDVIGIRVDNPVVSGILKPVEAKNRIILNPGRGNDLELNLDADAKFNLNGKPAAFLDFKEGMRVVAYLSLDRTMVVALRGGEDPGRRDNARRDGDGRDGRRPHYGIIVGIHPAKNSIEVLVGSNITIQGNEDLKIESYELAKGWIIHGSGNRIRPGKVTDLVKAIRVNLEWSADKKTVTKITLDDPVLRGTILAVDAVKKSITLELGRGADKTLPLSKDATITVAGKAATLADLKERMPAIVTLSLDRNQVVGIVIAGRPAERR